ncbi:hypothetical protein HERIO_184 [Hepatospora eriocheir]|uniref:Uncharacterized protein n=1 Tax=Hepatospora eriocheir TaxID=1081669 RepID=A0A1X0QEA8_9MICR|nr:hypothetical protein HERIO_184 [Hepatospora eriocheir]
MIEDEFLNDFDPIKFQELYQNTTINFVNKAVSPNFLYCQNCKKTTRSKKVGKFMLICNKLTKNKQKNNNNLFKCRECNKYYNIKLYRPVKSTSSFKDKKILISKKFSTFKNAAAKSCSKLASSVKKGSIKFVNRISKNFN